MTQKISTVSSLLKSIDQRLQEFHNITVRGEVSDLKTSSSGHLYFSLKENKALISAVCWRGVWQKLAADITLSNGLEVICEASVKIYSDRASLQLVVRNISIAGIGAILAAIENRKQRLAAEGLFDNRHKKPIPFMCRTIGVITSEKGSVIEDIKHRIAERMPSKILLWPVKVQGQASVAQIIAAIQGFNRIAPLPDVLIIARGGGSTEDLMVFNDEGIIRAIHASNIPIISAIGHETDYTLIDMVADKRAPTPTAAAEYATQVRSELLKILTELLQRMKVCLARYIDNLYNMLYATERVLLAFAHNLNGRENKIKHLLYQLQRAMDSLLNKNYLLVKSYNVNHLRHQLMARIQGQEHSLNHSKIALREAMYNYLNRRSAELELLLNHLKSSNYRDIMQRGFTRITDAQGHSLIDITQIKPTTQIEVHFVDGQVNATVNYIVDKKKA